MLFSWYCVDEKEHCIMFIYFEASVVKESDQKKILGLKVIQYNEE